MPAIVVAVAAAVLMQFFALVRVITHVVWAAVRLSVCLSIVIC